MKMEFIFDDAKLKKEGITKDWALDQIRAFFKACGREAIQEAEEGVFVAPISEVAYFGAACSFKRKKWFIRTIKEWYWTDEDSSWERKDVLESLAQIRKNVYGE